MGALPTCRPASCGCVFMACRAAWAPPASTMARLCSGFRNAKAHSTPQLCSHTWAAAWAPEGLSLGPCPEPVTGTLPAWGTGYLRAGQVAGQGTHHTVGTPGTHDGVLHVVITRDGPQRRQRLAHQVLGAKGSPGGGDGPRAPSWPQVRAMGCLPPTGMAPTWCRLSPSRSSRMARPPRSATSLQNSLRTTRRDKVAHSSPSTAGWSRWAAGGALSQSGAGRVAPTAPCQTPRPQGSIHSPLLPVTGVGRGSTCSRPLNKCIFHLNRGAGACC